MNRFPRIKKTLEILFVCLIIYWVVGLVLEKDNFESLPTEVAKDLEENLLGHWVRPKQDGLMLVTFGKNSMRMSDLSVGGASPQNMTVKYNQVKNGWSIDFILLSEVAENKMMVLFEDKETIMFGAPGLPFVKFKRTREVTDFSQIGERYKTKFFLTLTISGILAVICFQKSFRRGWLSFISIPIGLSASFVFIVTLLKWHYDPWAVFVGAGSVPGFFVLYCVFAIFRWFWAKTNEQNENSS